MLRPVQLALDHLADLAVMFPFLITRTQSMPAKDLGIHKSYPGLRFKCPGDLLKRLRDNLCRFTANRPIRRASDVSRPMP